LKKISLVKLLAIGSLIGVVSPVLADENKDNGWFIGVEGGAGKVFSGEYFDGSSADYGIKIGYYFTPSLRAYAAYNKNSNVKFDYTVYIPYYGTYDIESKADVDIFGIGYDALLGSGSLKFLAGLQIGYAKVSLDESIDRLGVSISQSKTGLNLGAKLGGLYDISEHHKIEVGVKTSLNFIKYNDGENDEYIKHIGLYAGYSYKF
jgi:hypothetical protein